jgi:hypothetical protein
MDNIILNWSILITAIVMLLTVSGIQTGFAQEKEARWD